MSSSPDTSTREIALAWLLTLRQVETKLPVLALRVDLDVRSLFHSLTPDERLEAIGLLLQMKSRLGFWFDECSKYAIANSFFRTASTT